MEAGKSIGPYEIVAKLGAGGMGEVYQAKDTRLGRMVAIKVLPQHLAANVQLRQRLEREAQAISALSHPNICALYDVGHQDGIDYLVMEYLEGETLAARLERGPLPNDEFLRYTIQIADALDKAHRQGIVHRDLKPGNVMLTQGVAKLLDFGLAKAESSVVSGSASLTASPTMSTPLTAQGTILGTYQYMSPEQLEGREADARSDLFALGCVMHEMITGKRAFEAQSQAGLIGSIMQTEPPKVSALQPMAPPALDRVIQACLAKNPEERWQTAHDVLLQLRWIEEGGSVAGVPAPVAARRRNRERLAWVSCAAAIVAAGLFAFGFFARSPQPLEAVRFEVAASPEMASMGSPKISPDGRRIAFDAVDTRGSQMLWVRSLDALEARPLPGTEGAGRPFWSPDSRYLAYFSGGKLRKVAVSGTPPQTVCDAPTGSDGTWGSRDVILYDGNASDPIRMVPASGGVAKPLVQGSDVSAGSVGWPDFLPDGRHFLFTSVGTGENHLYVGSTEPGFEPVEVLSTSSLVLFAAPRHLIYVRDDTLVAQPFDLDGLKLRGEPVPLAEEVGTTGVGLAHISASTNGVLVYRAGETAARRLVRVDLEGKELEEIGKPEEYWSSSLSPSGDRVVIDIGDPGNGNGELWVRDLKRGVSSRFTFDPADDHDPLWSPDGRTIWFSSDRNEKNGIYRKDASGAGEAELVYESPTRAVASSFSPDGSHLAYHALSEDASWDIWILPLAGDRAGEPYPFVQTQFIEVRPRFSPDGKWITYDSVESGRIEVYARRFEGSGGKWQISTNGGFESSWGPDGTELFYIGTDRKLTRVDVQAGETLQVGLPEPLFDALTHPQIMRNHYVVDSGKRFLMVRSMGRDTILPATVVLNWDTVLRN